MFAYHRIKPKRTKRDLMDVESILESGLRPISPRPEFIQSLHKGLVNDTFPELESPGYDLRKPFVIGLIGLLSLIFILSVWIRLLLVIMSTVGMIQASKRKRNIN
jgi:hypothetical protein